MRAVDLFAGWGGFTQGATAAGVDVVWAANHWPLAVRAHERNHPSAIHVCQDLRQADFTKLPAYELLLASPACQGHSTASQPKRRAKHDADRATAWAVIDCAEATDPRAIIVENVPAFASWALFDVWIMALEKLGYHVQHRTINATDFGVAQRRKRIVIVATKHERAIDLPSVRSEIGFGSCLEYEPRARWRDVTAAVPNVRARIAKGRRNCGSRFLSQHVTDHPGVPLDEPIRTITTKDQWILVDGDRYRSLTVRELARGMSFPDSYTWPAEATRKDCIKGIGNAIPPRVAQGMIERVRAIM